MYAWVCLGSLLVFFDSSRQNSRPVFGETTNNDEEMRISECVVIIIVINCSFLLFFIWFFYLFRFYLLQSDVSWSRNREIFVTWPAHKRQRVVAIRLKIYDIAVGRRISGQIIIIAHGVRRRRRDKYGAGLARRRRGGTNKRLKSAHIILYIKNDIIILNTL